MLAPEIVTDSFYQFFSRQLSLWLDNRSLAVYPMRLDWIQPRAFDWQSQSKYPHPAFSLHSLIVLLDPTPHFLALVPTGIVPDQNQHPFAFFSQLPNYPFKEVGRHLAHGATFYKSQQQFICVAPPPARSSTRPAGQGLLCSFQAERASTVPNQSRREVEADEACSTTFHLHSPTPNRSRAEASFFSLSSCFFSMRTADQDS